MFNAEFTVWPFFQIANSSLVEALEEGAVKSVMHTKPFKATYEQLVGGILDDVRVRFSKPFQPLDPINDIEGLATGTEPFCHILK
jgi:hypothetical protein